MTIFWGIILSRKFKFFWFLICPLVLAVYLVPLDKTREIKIKGDEFPFQQYISIDDPARESNFVSDFLGFSLGLDRLNVCIKNRTQIEKNGSIVSPEDSIVSNGELSVEIYPFNINLALEDTYSFLKEKNKFFFSDGKQIVYYRNLSAKQNDTHCLSISIKNGGFFFSIPQLDGFGSIAVPPPQNGEDYFQGRSVVVGGDIIKAKFNDSKFFTKANLSAYLAKLLAFWSLWVGFWLLVRKVFIIVNKENN